MTVAVTNLLAEVPTAGSLDGPTIGVLALQGGFHEHHVMLSKLGAQVREVRQTKDLDEQLDGLVVPGGESTTMAHLAPWHSPKGLNLNYSQRVATSLSKFRA